MNLLWVKTNWIVKKMFSGYVWDKPNSSKKIYLTFDDGPIPEITEWVLDQLMLHKVKATFFCIGNNINNNPTIFKRVINDGHSIGNHTYNHLNGWNTKTSIYIADFEQCTKKIQQHSNDCENHKLFRPPYGKIKSAQAKAIKKLGYKIIMWDVLSVDFDAAVPPEQCLENVVKNVESGSIIVFHDSIKAFKNLKYALPKVLNSLKERGFVFDVL